MPAIIRDFVWEISPPWLRRYWGERMMGVQGLMGDLGMEGVSQGFQAPWLRSGFQPPDALPLVGNERSMPRYYADTDATYRERLAEAWDSWLFAGNEDSLIDQLNAFGLPGVAVVPAENADLRVERPSWRFELVPRIGTVPGVIITYNDDDGGGDSEITGVDVAVGFTVGRKVYIIDSPLNSNDTGYEITAIPPGNSTITLDGIVLSDEGPGVGSWLDGTEFSRFAVVIEAGHPWVEWTYGSGHIYGDDDDSPTYGSTATVGEVRSIKSIIRKWSAGHAINPRIYIVFPDVLSGVSEYYGDPTTLYGDAGLVYGGGADSINWQHQL